MNSVSLFIFIRGLIEKDYIISGWYLSWSESL